MTTLRSRLSLFMVLAAFLLALAPFSARAAEPTPLRLESKPLWAALNDFAARQTNLQLLYPMDEVLQSGRSREIVGCLSVDQCLAELLKDTGLQFEAIGPNTIIIRRVAPPHDQNWAQIQFARALELYKQALNIVAAGGAEVRSLLMRGTRIEWSFAQLATRKSGLSLLSLATGRVEALTTRGIVISRPDALRVESRLGYAPCHAPGGGSVDCREPCCFSGRFSAEWKKAPLVAVAMLSGPLASALLADPTPIPQSLTDSASLPIAHPRQIRPSSPRAPPLSA